MEVICLHPLLPLLQPFIKISLHCLPDSLYNNHCLGQFMNVFCIKYDLITNRAICELVQAPILTIADAAPNTLPTWLQILTTCLPVLVGMVGIVNSYYIIQEKRLERKEKIEEREAKNKLSSSIIIPVSYTPNSKIEPQSPAITAGFGDINSKILKILNVFGITYWILTGPLPLVSLYRSQQSSSKCWTIATTLPHLYLHSMCVGLFMALSLRSSTVAVILSPRLRKQTVALMVVLVALVIPFIHYQVAYGQDLYRVDTTGFVLPLSTALQTFSFGFAMVIGWLTVSGVLVYNLPLLDARIVNQLLSTALYASLWIPMRIAYESQYSQLGPVQLSTNHKAQTWLIAIMFMLCIFSLSAVFKFKKRVWFAPLTTAACTVCILCLGMFPKLCQVLFGRDSEVIIFLGILSFAAHLWVSTTVPNNTQS